MRSKLKLNLDELTIDSFDTTSSVNVRGTVVGEEQCTCWTACGQNTCPGCPTCDVTCNNTCDDLSCANSCGCPVGTYDYTCEGCTWVDATCNGYGTCGVYPCKQIP